MYLKTQASETPYWTAEQCSPVWWKADCCLLYIGCVHLQIHRSSIQSSISLGCSGPAQISGQRGMAMPNLRAIDALQPILRRLEGLLLCLWHRPLNTVQQHMQHRRLLACTHKQEWRESDLCPSAPLPPLSKKRVHMSEVEWEDFFGTNRTWQISWAFLTTREGISMLATITNRVDYFRMHI
jgi:hypothetical protein